MFMKLFSETPNRPDLSALFSEFNSAHFEGLIPQLELEWNTRKKVVSGTCHYKRSGFSIVPYKIEMSDLLFAEFDYDMTKVRATFLHELCHAYCCIKYGERGHGYWFQYTMREITGVNKNHRCHSYPIQNLRNEKKSVIIVFCESCQKEIGTKPKMPAEKMLRRGFTHRACGGRVNFHKVSIGGESNKSIKLF